MSWKQWNIGEVVEAGDFQSLVQDQVVQTYADAAARGTALGTAVSEGMVAYTSDDNTLSVYNGSEWGQVAQAISPNYIINGAFDIWQRGTSFSNPASATYLADRYAYSYNGTGATRTISRQSFTPDELPTPSLGESEFYLRFDQSDAGTGNTFNTLVQRIEDVRTLAGQTATISFYTKAASSTALPLVRTLQRFGSGGSAVVTTTIISSVAVGTTWQRNAYTFTVPSISGKTIGAGSSLEVQFFFPVGVTFTVDLWGVQLEAGSVATPFRKNANSIQGELAACQRYFQRWGGQNKDSKYSTGFCLISTRAQTSTYLPVQMRATPSISLGSAVTFGNVTATQTPTLVSNRSSTQVVSLYLGVAGVTAKDPAYLYDDSVNSYFDASAEL